MAGETRGTTVEMELHPILDRLYRLNVEQYERMTEVGILGTEDRVELLDGLIVEKVPKSPSHAVCTALLTKVLYRVLPDTWFLSMGNAVPIPERRSEPEPDVQVVRGEPRDYLVRRHGPGDAALVVEVADATYSFDRRWKWSLYAWSSIPVYWIFDLNRRLLEVFTDPTGPADEPYYRRALTYGPGDGVPLVLDGREVARVAVDDLLP